MEVIGFVFQHRWAADQLHRHSPAREGARIKCRLGFGALSFSSSGRLGSSVLSQLEMEYLGRLGRNKTPDEENSMSMQRRHFTTDQKATILKRYLVS
jgi:hypothetical protein